jgi:hypothetical protein
VDQALKSHDRGQISLLAAAQSSGTSLFLNGADNMDVARTPEPPCPSPLRPPALVVLKQPVLGCHFKFLDVAIIDNQSILAQLRAYSDTVSAAVLCKITALPVSHSLAVNSVRMNRDWSCGRKSNR